MWPVRAHSRKGTENKPYRQSLSKEFIERRGKGRKEMASWDRAGQRERQRDREMLRERGRSEQSRLSFMF